MKSQRIQFSLNFISKHKNHEDPNSRVPHFLGRYSKKKKKYQHYTLQVAVKLELKSMQMSWGSGEMFLVLLVCGDWQAHSRLRHKFGHAPVCGTTVWQWNNSVWGVLHLQREAANWKVFMHQNQQSTGTIFSSRFCHPVSAVYCWCLGL